MDFLNKWGDAAYTTLGFFWMAMWAFILGYFISSMIQVFVTRERMKRTMGKAGAKSVGLATFFGFISSSCSFAALATTKSLFKKGAGLIPSVAFLLSSTNLVIELGIVIGVFLSWHFIAGEYIGGILLILIAWVFIKFTKPKGIIKKARKRLEEKADDEDREIPDWKKLIRSKQGWSKVGNRYINEWLMVWKDVTIGFTVAGIIAAFVPSEFFQWLFIGTGEGDTSNLSFLQILQHTIVGPVAAFFTFIGSMGNIPLAALLYNNGVSMAGVMAFIFSDLVVLPVLRINARYYGWRMALYILLTLLIALIASSLLLHYGFHLFDIAPQGSGGSNTQEQQHFQLDYTFYLNMVFLAVSAFLIVMAYRFKASAHMEMADKGWVEKVLSVLAIISFIWLAGGMVARYLIL